MPTLSPQQLRSRLGKVCVAIIGASPDELLEKALVAMRDTNFLEFRLDYLPDPLAALPRLGTFLGENPTVLAIATCRSKPSGGRFAGSPAAELDLLSRAARAGFHFVDVSLETAEAVKPSDLAALRETGVALMVSHHDFTATRDLDGAYARIAAFHPDFTKIVSTAKSLTDNITLIRFLERMADVSSIVGTCMGEAGVISRVLGVRAGSAFTFAAASQGDETAPGQIDARSLFDIYRIDQVDTATKIYGVAGNPVSHSLSPLMLNTAFRRETLNAVYLALQTARVDDLLRLVAEIPIQGLSITMPLKQEILPHLERMDPLSKKIGAVNTVLRTADGKLYGFNTDVAGIIAPLEKRLSLRGARVLVLGAGGAARAAVFGLVDKGAEVVIVNRTHETAQKLARQASAKAIKRELIGKQQFDVILNATPAGMFGHKTQSLLTPEEIKAKLVFDMVYNPLETPLLHMARQQNIPVITGLEMFVQQGARQFEIWTGKPAPEEEMLRVVLHTLRQRAATPATPPKPVADNPAPASASTSAPGPASRPALKATPRPAIAAASKPASKPPSRPVAASASRPQPSSAAASKSAPKKQQPGVRPPAKRKAAHA